MSGLWPEALEEILEVTRKLAAPFDLITMLQEVIDAAKDVLKADGGSVWLYDERHDELAMQVATAMEPIRLPADRGIVGQCAQTRQIINVPDCYADPRFNRDIDRQTGYRTRCLLSLPLIGHEGSLIGVLQIFNKRDGVFEVDDENIAAALAAQCAVALQRVRMTEALMLSEKLDQEIRVAREIQMGTLPKETPSIPGYDIAGLFRPTDQTGGDTFDFIPLGDDRLFILVGDATGHGIGPALSATQVRAMLRVALRLGADLDATFVHINNQLADDLPADRFVTAFMGLLDGRLHQVRFHAGGQGPLLHFHGATGDCDWYPASTLPMGFMPQQRPAPSKTIDLAPGDVLGLISDGIYEYEDAEGRQFGQERVAAIIGEHRGATAAQLVGRLLDAAREFGGEAPQADDITIVLIQRMAI